MSIMNEKIVTTDEVYMDLCIKIEKLVYMPGESISENDLCKTYGVTRHIVRNAITRLKDRRLITVYPQRGTFVSLIDIGLVEDILYIRESIEQETLRRIMDLEDNSELVVQLMKNIVLQKETIKDELPMEKFYEVDNEFHVCLLKAVGKSDVMSLIQEQYIHVRRWRNFEVRNINRLKDIVEDHEDIVESIKNKKTLEGRECLHRHLDTVTRLSSIFKTAEPEYFIFR
ncbi:MAG: GntR family transcriptional regulator [Mobilitalea sp.]